MHRLFNSPCNRYVKGDAIRDKEQNILKISEISDQSGLACHPTPSRCGRPPFAQSASNHETNQISESRELARVDMQYLKVFPFTLFYPESSH